MLAAVVVCVVLGKLSSLSGPHFITYKMGKLCSFRMMMNSQGYNKCERGSFLNTLLFYILVAEAYILLLAFKKKKRILVLQRWDGFYAIQLLRPLGNFLWQSPQGRDESNTTS